MGNCCSSRCGWCGRCTDADEARYPCLDCGELRADELETVCWLCLADRRERQRDEDDGSTYADPRDELDRRKFGTG